MLKLTVSILWKKTCCKRRSYKERYNELKKLVLIILQGITVVTCWPVNFLLRFSILKKELFTKRRGDLLSSVSLTVATWLGLGQTEARGLEFYLDEGRSLNPYAIIMLVLVPETWHVKWIVFTSIHKGPFTFIVTSSSILYILYESYPHRR